MTTTAAEGRKSSAYERWCDRAAATLDRLMAEGRHPLASPIKPGAPVRPFNGLTGHWYQATNCWWLHIMAVLEAYAEHRWLTYRQAQALGGQVRKGEKGTLILVFRPARRSQDKDEDKTDEPQRRGWFTTATVFNAQQIDDLPAPATASVEPLDAVAAKAEAFARATGANIRPTDISLGSELGAYSPSQDRIRIRPRASFTHSAEYYSVLFHELAHWTGHDSRLSRSLAEGFDDKEAYAREELRAEMAAFTLATTFGLGFEPRRSAQYLEHWGDGLGDPRIYAQAATEASAIVRFLCELADPDGALLPRKAAPAAVASDAGGSHDN